MRQIVLDTETTGLSPEDGHRVIEIGCVELLNRKLTGNHFHCYLNPERRVDPEAMKVHGITDAFLLDKPLFQDIVDDFIRYIRDAELVIHNAPFDVGFLNAELARIRGKGRVEDVSTILDTLTMARKKHPGQRNNLDVLCRRYGIDNSHRELHGALLDAEILADVYIGMTSGQATLGLSDNGAKEKKAMNNNDIHAPQSLSHGPISVLKATSDELQAHDTKLAEIEDASGACIWKNESVH